MKDDSVLNGGNASQKCSEGADEEFFDVDDLCSDRLRAARLICETIERKLNVVQRSINQSDSSVVSEFTKQSVKEIGLYILLLRDALQVCR